MAAGGHVDDRDVGLVHHRRLGREVHGQREFLPVGADVVELGAGLPRLKRESRSGEEIASAAGRDVGREDVRRAAVGEPLVPEAVLGTLGEVGLDLLFLALLPALHLRLFGREIGPDPGDEGDALAVGKPAQSRSAVGDGSEPPRLAAVGRDQIDLRLLVVLALGREGDPFAVGRPGGLAVLVAGGQPLRAAAVGRKEPKLGPALVLFHVVRADRGTREATVGRERRRSDPLDRPEIFDAEGTLATRHGGSARWIDRREAPRAAHCTGPMIGAPAAMR